MANSTNEVGFPHTIHIQPFATPVSSVGTWGLIVSSTSIKNAWLENTSNTQNDEADWNVVLGPGTWTMEILSNKGSDSGIIDVQLDGVSEGTIDQYDGAGPLNVSQSVAGIVVVEGGQKELKFLMSTKNASSSGYRARFTGIYFRRTGA